jgi:hypothetical protein
MKFLLQTNIYKLMNKFLLNSTDLSGFKVHQSVSKTIM